MYIFFLNCIYYRIIELFLEENLGYGPKKIENHWCRINNNIHHGIMVNIFKSGGLIFFLNYLQQSNLSRYFLFKF